MKIKLFNPICSYILDYFHLKEIWLFECLNFISVVKFFIQNGADIYAKNNKGKTPIQECLAYYNSIFFYPTVNALVKGKDKLKFVKLEKTNAAENLYLRLIGPVIKNPKCLIWDWMIATWTIIIYNLNLRQSYKRNLMLIRLNKD